jgi:hypothetical protein
MLFSYDFTYYSTNDLLNYATGDRHISDKEYYECINILTTRSDDASELDVIMKFINTKTGEMMEHIDFVEMVWEEAEDRYEHTGFLWCNLDSYEQNQCYCIQFEDYIREGWIMVPAEWKLN